MPVDSAVDLVNALRLSQLLAPAQLEDLTQNLLPRHPDAKSLARVLLDREWLTPYQVNMLMQGQGAKLVHNPYVILERLGDNALGQVFKARHHLMNRAVTLTIVREELLKQPETVEQFYREIQANSQLSDPHIVHAYDAGPIGPTHFFATEYVDGIDLDRLVQQSGRVPVFVACAFIQQAATGLAHAHERGLLHHDLRPANLLVAKLGSLGSTSITAQTPLPSSDQLRDAILKIANMGLTLLQPRLRRNATTKSEDSLDYVAPEQGQGNATPDIRASLYSLGCIFYFLLTGRAPFAGTGSSVKLKQHQSEEPKALDAFRRDVPNSVRDIIHTLLAKKPEDRYQSPAELLAALANVSTRWTVPVPEVTAKPPSRPMKKPLPAVLPRLGMPSRFRLGIIGAVVALLLVLAILAGWLLRSREKPRETHAEKPVPNVVAPAPVLPTYVKKESRRATILATLKASGLPAFEGKWWTITPFDNRDGKGFDAVYPPETEINLTKTYTGKDNLPVQWKEWTDFRYDEVRDLKPRSPQHENVVVYLCHEVEVAQPVTAELSLGSDDTLTVWLNGQRLLAKNVTRGAEPDQDRAVLHLQPGKNQLLIKICQGGGGWAVYVMPRWPESLRKQFQSNLDRDFP